MNEFEQQIRRAFDHMFEHIPVPPPDQAVERLERNRRKRRVQRYWMGGVTAAAAAGLLALASWPQWQGGMHDQGVAYHPHSTATPAPSSEGSSSHPDQGNLGRQSGAGSQTEHGETAGTVSSGQSGSETSGGKPGIGSGSVNPGVVAPGDGKVSPPAVPNSGGNAAIGPNNASQPGGKTPGTTDSGPSKTTGGSSDKAAASATPAPSGSIVLPSAWAMRWTPYQPSFIPAGYEPVVDFASATDPSSSGAKTTGVRWTYQGPSGELLIIVQQPIGPGTDAPWTSPASPYPREQTTVHGQAAVFQMGNNNLLHLIWVESNTRFDIATNADKQILLQVANGLAPSPSAPQQP
ncbi:MAG: hypothetical protein QJR01_07800 [Kyrpidia sp.]|nr:hypothetical protein [Kyrpidia sp.]